MNNNVIQFQSASKPPPEVDWMQCAFDAHLIPIRFHVNAETGLDARSMHIAVSMWTALYPDPQQALIKTYPDPTVGTNNDLSWPTAGTTQPLILTHIRYYITAYPDQQQVLHNRLSWPTAGTSQLVLYNNLSWPTAGTTQPLILTHSRYFTADTV